jgi:hypothetical protein
MKIIYFLGCNNIYFGPFTLIIFFTRYNKQKEKQAYLQIFKSYIFCDITVCSLLQVNCCLGITHCLHSQGRRITVGRNQRESRWYAVPAAFMLTSCAVYSLTLKMEASEKIELFITTAVRTSNFTNLDRWKFFLQSLLKLFNQTLVLQNVE